MRSRADAPARRPAWRAALAAAARCERRRRRVAHAATRMRDAAPLDAARDRGGRISRARRSRPRRHGRKAPGVRSAKRPSIRRRPPLPWLVALARWLAESGRVLVWLLAAVVLAVVLVTARRWLRVHGDAIGTRGARLPSHVRELDIRPECLPADIGAAVRELWLAGERRARALAALPRRAVAPRPLVPGRDRRCEHRGRLRPPRRAPR